MDLEIPELDWVVQDVPWDVSRQLESTESVTPKWTNEQLNASLDNYDRDSDGHEPADFILHWAVTFNYLDTVEKALTKGCKIDDLMDYDQFPYKICALGLAAMQGHTDAMKLLLEKKTPNTGINTTDMYGNTPLWHATDRSHTDMVELLLSVGADPFVCSFPPDLPAARECPLFAAIRVGHEQVIDAYVDLSQEGNIVNRNFGDTTPLVYAIETGSVYAVRKLLRHPKIDVNERDNPRRVAPLPRAIQLQHLEMVEMLLQHKDIKREDWRHIGGQNVYEAAILDGNVDILRLLLTTGVNPSMSKLGFTHLPPLMLAIKTGKRDMAKVLVDDDRVDLGQCATNKWTALVMATVFGAHEMVKCILAKNAATFWNDNNLNGIIALDYAEFMCGEREDTEIFEEGLHDQVQEWRNAWGNSDDGWDVDYSKTLEVLEDFGRDNWPEDGA